MKKDTNWQKIKMATPTIFTKAEESALNRRLKGDKNDSTGIYCMRVKPKLLELLEWFKKRKQIEKLLYHPSKANQRGEEE